MCKSISLSCGGDILSTRTKEVNIGKKKKKPWSCSTKVNQTDQNADIGEVCKHRSLHS